MGVQVSQLDIPFCGVYLQALRLISPKRLTLNQLKLPERQDELATSWCF